MKKILSFLLALLAVSQMWAGTYYLMQNSHTSGDKGTMIMQCPESSSPYTAEWTCTTPGTYYFYITSDPSSEANSSCDFQNNGKTFTDGEQVQVYKYGTSNYQHSITLNAEKTGVYTFRFTDSNPSYITCSFPGGATLAEGDLLSILKGEKVESYYANGFNGSVLYMGTSGQANDILNNAALSSSRATFVQGENSAQAKYIAVCVTPARYYISNKETWNGVRMAANPVAGNAYILGRLTVFGGEDANHIDVLPSLSTPTWTVSSATITEGDASCTIAASVPTTSVASFTNSVKYYIQKGESYQEINLSHLEDLTAGTYSIWAIGTDGNVRVRSTSAATLTVTATTPEPIVYSIKTNWKEGGWDAGFKELTVNEDGTQSMTETFTGNGFNISPNFLGTNWYPVDKLNLVGGVAVNDLVTISVNPNATSQEEVFTITKISDPLPIVYSIKTNWKDGGWDAGFKELTVNEDGTQSIEETYTGNGFNISPAFLGTGWYPVDKLNLVGGVAANDLVTISVNPNATSQEEVFTITKISSPEPEPEPELDPINVTVRVYTTADAPKIWWWGGGIAAPTVGWDNRPSMNKEGETNWYSWTFEGVNATSGISYKITATEEKSFSGVKEDKCLDANLDNLDCEYAPEPEPEPEPEPTPDHLYILGNIEGIGWEPAASAEMTKEGDIFTGTYTFTGAPSYFAFTTVQGSWDDVNANRYHSAALTAGADPIALVKENESSTIAQGKYTITVDWANMTVVAEEVETEPTLETNVYLAGTFNGWSTTSHNFVRENLGDEVAYTTIAGVSTSGDIEFKVVEGGIWCNGVTETITSESTSVTFRSDDSEGYQVKMTPYAVGDYKVAFNLTTRVLTVTYPAGEKMEETHEIALAGTFNSWGDEHPAFTKNSLTSYTVTQNLTAGSYEFRVIVDGTWKGANYTITRDYCTDVVLGADQNFSLTADKSGDYVFDYNPQTQMLNVTYPELETRTAYFLNTPGYETVYAYVYNANGGLVDWPGELATATGEQQYGYDVYSYTFSEVYTGVIFHGYTGTQVEFAFDPAKPYITEAGAVAELSDINVVKATISAYQYSTLYSDKALRIPAGVTVEYVSGVVDNALVRETLTDIIPANTGVMISGPANTEFTFVEAKAVNPIEGNLLKGTLATETIVNNGLVHYILSLNESGVFGLYWPYGTGANHGVGDFTNQAGKAYLELPSDPAAAPRGFALRHEDTTTSIQTLDADAMVSTKVIRDGQLYIIRNSEIYTLQGVRVQ